MRFAWHLAADTFQSGDEHVVVEHIVAFRLRTASANWSYLRAHLIAKRFYRIGGKVDAARGQDRGRQSRPDFAADQFT